MTRLVDEIDALHTTFVEAVNRALEVDDVDRARDLAAAYDVEVTTLIAEREGLTHLLPLRRAGAPDSRLRSLVRRLTHHRAA